MCPPPGGELGRIVDQVSEDLLEPRLIRLHKEGDVGERDRKLMVPRLDLVTGRFDSAVQDCAKVYPLRPELDVTPIQPDDIEQIIA
jgi:hypothetical protein